MGRPEVAASLAPRVGAEVLERGDHAAGEIVALQPAHVGAHHEPRQVRILGDALLDAAPARVADHVRHRRQRLVRAQRPHLAANHGPHSLHELGIPAGSIVQRRRKLRGPLRHHARQRLLVGDGGDAEARVLQQVALELVHGAGAPFGLDRARAEGSRELPHAVAQQLGHVEAARGPAAAGPVLAGVARRPEPDGEELRDLLLERHAFQQVGGALVGGEPRIAIGSTSRVFAHRGLPGRYR